MPRSHGRQILGTRRQRYADTIVSGDADLLDLDPFRGIPILTPAVFVQHWSV